MICICVCLWKLYINCMRQCMKCYYKYAFQLFGLFLYGGVNLLDVDSNIPVLSQNPSVIESFAIIVALNCIFEGTLLIGYIALWNIFMVKYFLH